MNHTKGPWRADSAGLLGSIVADAPTGEPNIDKPDHVEAYQGFLVAESVLPQNRPIIAAAPEMLDLLETIRDADEDCRKDNLPRILPAHIRAKLDELIAKAGGR